MNRNHALAYLAVPVGDSDHARGPADAAVTLVEYGDFECPACGEAFPVVEELRDRLGPACGSCSATSR
jgi:protein-disulfide isomerase